MFGLLFLIMLCLLCVFCCSYYYVVVLLLCCYVMLLLLLLLCCCCRCYSDVWLRCRRWRQEEGRNKREWRGGISPPPKKQIDKIKHLMHVLVYVLVVLDRFIVTLLLFPHCCFFLHIIMFISFLVVVFATTCFASLTLFDCFGAVLVFCGLWFWIMVQHAFLLFLLATLLTST